jgi:hypothetical protein
MVSDLVFLAGPAISRLRAGRCLLDIRSDAVILIALLDVDGTSDGAVRARPARPAAPLSAPQPWATWYRVELLNSSSRSGAA